MKIDWTFRGEPLSDGLQKRIGRQLTKLAGLLRDPVSAHVVVGDEGHERVDLEVVLTSEDGIFKGHADGHELGDVTKDALQRVEAQVRKVNNKRLATRRHAVELSDAGHAEEE